MKKNSFEIIVEGIPFYFEIDKDGYLSITTDGFQSNSQFGRFLLTEFANVLRALQTNADREYRQDFQRTIKNNNYGPCLDPEPSVQNITSLRYGENPHQSGRFLGDLSGMLEQLHGSKQLSYNNLLDVDAAICLMTDFLDEAPTFAILKHNNACGLAVRSTISKAYDDALAGDPVSAFGGILISNTEINEETAQKINQLFCEVVIAPSYTTGALERLRRRPKRIVLLWKPCELPPVQFRTILNGILVQDRDAGSEEILEPQTNRLPSPLEVEDLRFANKVIKHTKSNAIVLAKNKQLVASGTGQTSRVDALRQAIEKAGRFNFDLQGAVMASDAFFPFPDCVEIASQAGITAVIQPGGSIKDQLSIDYCNEHDVSMVFTGRRHFKH